MSPASSPSGSTRALLVCGAFVVSGGLGLARMSPPGAAALPRSAGPTRSTSDRATGPTSAAFRTSTTRPAVTAADVTTTSVDIGALSQTDEQPTTSSAVFRDHASMLWQAIVADDPDRALGAFFPRSAYVQVKDIADPGADWRNRLVANFRTDVHDLHAQLGSAGATATFERLDVPSGAAEWIQPGVEYNKGSYWRVYGSRLLYLVDGVEQSLPVTSLISWRGEWYVVHLGAIR